MSKGKIAFVTDSTAYLSKELQQHPDVYVVPIVVISEGVEYEDGVDLSSEQLYEIIRTNKQVPKTSQPNVSKFEELYEHLKQKYDSAIAVHISNKLSGTISSSLAGKEQAEFEVEIVDSYSLSHAITTLIYKGLQLTEKMDNVKNIANELREEAKRSRNLILLGNLDQLYKGGRMSGAQFLLGNVLQIKPILSINEEGELKLLERVRSEKKATNRIIDLLKQSSDNHTIKQVQIMHGNVLNKANELKAKINETIPNLEVIVGEISSSLAVHAGEGTLAMIWHEEKQ
ncbi:DegV family protein [Evansella cellulosilytica]|uniref:DegV family protein n=1 Tax=Evansella cellulosilytica (strain ATCC 21833 / DSM 2522 / FERM P-1141 / JCM 9156 / N-4) TaxID=649639 RepID=E6TQL9_EVAC2|nr:DegV family protein [Evansella cellulosilytica]ADU30530.1 degV family protein [Evansella cellulosilytica DSM 2522]